MPWKFKSSNVTLLPFFLYLTTRAIMLAEFLFCFYTDHLYLWCIQFFFTTWWNLFMIVSSHDFEESETKADLTPG